MTSIGNIEHIKKGALDLIVLSDTLAVSCRESDCESLIESTEKNLANSIIRLYGDTCADALDLYRNTQRSSSALSNGSRALKCID